MSQLTAQVTPLLVAALALTSGCGALTREEAQEALEEVKLSSQTQALTSNSVELTTEFSIGDAREAAAQELRDFVTGQLPCAEITIDKNPATNSSTTLTIEYGVNAGSCTYRGQTFSGKHTVSVARNDADLVEVDHIWEDLSNGIVRMNGTASVDWDLENKSRHVVHSTEWTRISDGRTGEGSGDRVQRALEGGILEGFSVDGNRGWKGSKGEWSLDIDNVEMRWADAVPQAGKYTLDTPFDKELSVEFQRESATKIGVTIAGPRRSFDFSVVTLPGGDSQTLEMGASEADDE